MLLEFLRDIHVLRAFKRPRIDDVSDDRLVFAREILVESIDELRARDGRVGHVALHGGNFATPECMKRSALLAILLSSTMLSAQTRIVAPDNNYTPAQDVELGLKAASEARQTLPVLQDDEIAGYIQSIGRRLVAAIPPDLQHP